MILIVSSRSDLHAAAVLNELTARKADVTLLDLSQFPTEMHLAMEYTHGKDPLLHLRLSDGFQLPLSECRAIWWRRPQPFVLSPNLTREAYRQFAYNESHEAFTGLWQLLNAFWINHPTRDLVAHRKAYQLSIAQSVGLSIPHTLITNNPIEARRFIAQHGHEQTIYKAFSATEREWRETRLLHADEVKLLDNVRYAPVIFQEYIEAEVDLRITIIGKELFPAAIYSQETTYKVDFRMDIAKARVEAIKLPTDVTSQLGALMSALGLVYGAIDMRLTPDGRYVFLEINPAGQWLFIEQRTEQPMTTALVNLLIAQDQRATKDA
jgi:glutathione synthase/RimK-type ligase-like ATP-grasp enzyme